MTFAAHSRGCGRVWAVAAAAAPSGADDVRGTLARLRARFWAVAAAAAPSGAREDSGTLARLRPSL